MFIDLRESLNFYRLLWIIDAPYKTKHDEYSTFLKNIRHFSRIFVHDYAPNVISTRPSFDVDIHIFYICRAYVAQNKRIFMYLDSH